MESRTILVIDDDLQFRSRFVRTARNSGYEVVEAADGEQGMEILARQRATIDLALIDLVLPGTYSGLDVVLALTRQPVNSTKIVVTSALWRPTSLALVKHVGADAILQKSPGPEYFRDSEWME